MSNGSVTINVGEQATEHIEPGRTIMRLIIRIIGMAVIAGVVGRLILKRTSGPGSVEKMMVEVMPKVMDQAFGKLAPAKREEMLAHLHTTLAGLEEKYGHRNEQAEEPTE